MPEVRERDDQGIEEERRLQGLEWMKDDGMKQFAHGLL
jgi:hypothetical protein